MPYSDHKKHSLETLEQEIASLRLQLDKKRKLRDSLNQQLLSVGSHKEKEMDLIEVEKEAEKLEKQISEIQVDIQHLDTRVSKLHHRADKVRHEIE